MVEMLINYLIVKDVLIKLILLWNPQFKQYTWFREKSKMKFGEK